MNQSPKRSTVTVIALLLLFAGCVTHITVDVTQNPPPTTKFASFNRFEVEKISMLPPYAGQPANETALMKIQENVDAKLKPLLASWNRPDSGPVRTLQVKPVITEIKFISGGKRFWAGALAGSSAVILRVSITEKETGRVIATPEFYSRAAAMGGAWSFGGTDNAMLVRIANRFTSYMRENYDQAVGGPTGAEPAK